MTAVADIGWFGKRVAELDNLAVRATLDVLDLELTSDKPLYSIPQILAMKDIVKKELEKRGLEIKGL